MGSFITYLTHLATSAVDADHGLSYSRYPILTTTDEWLLLTTGLCSFFAICGAATLYLLAINAYGPRGVCRPRCIMAIALVLIGAGCYAFWFYAIARNFYAPDFENVGLDASWWHHLGGVILAATCVTYFLYRGWHASGERSMPPTPLQESINLPLAAENYPGLALIFWAAFIHLSQSVWHSYGNPIQQSPWESVGDLLYQPDTYFMAALLIRSLQLMRLRWKGTAPAPLTLVAVTSSEFVTSWLLLAAIVAVSIPTFAAFSFSFWLGPWYRW